MAEQTVQRREPERITTLMDGEHIVIEQAWRTVEPFDRPTLGHAENTVAQGARPDCTRLVPAQAHQARGAVDRQPVALKMLALLEGTSVREHPVVVGEGDARPGAGGDRGDMVQVHAFVRRGHQHVRIRPAQHRGTVAPPDGAIAVDHEIRHLRTGSLLRGSGRVIGQPVREIGDQRPTPGHTHPKAVLGAGDTGDGPVVPSTVQGLRTIADTERVEAERSPAVGPGPDPPISGRPHGKDKVIRGPLGFAEGHIHMTIEIGDDDALVRGDGHVRITDRALRVHVRIVQPVAGGQPLQGATTPDMHAFAIGARPDTAARIAHERPDLGGSIERVRPQGVAPRSVATKHRTTG